MKHSMSRTLCCLLVLLSPTFAARRHDETLRQLSHHCSNLPSTNEISSLNTAEATISSSSSLSTLTSTLSSLPYDSLSIRGGGWIVPAGWNPLGYRITPLGEDFLSFHGSLESDLGRFLASLKTHRKRYNTIKEQWLEVLRVSKTAQSMRVYKQLNELVQFCLKAGLID